MANADVMGGSVPREALLARALVELADTLVADFDVVELLTRLADRCVEVLGVGAAGLMLAGPMASSGSWPPPAKARGCWNCSSCKPKKDLAWTVTAAANR
jgi:hypothetical protein